QCPAARGGRLSGRARGARCTLGPAGARAGPGNGAASGMTLDLRASERGTPARRIIAISASAGGLAALRALLGDLPASLAASILVVQQLQPHRHSHLVEILGWSCSLDVCESRPALRLWCGTVYVAPPDL